MPEPRDLKKNAEEPQADERRSEIPRLIGAAFMRERKRTEQSLNGLLLAIRSDLGRIEERVYERLDQIDTSLNLMAQEISRGSNDCKPDGAGRS